MNLDKDNKTTILISGGFDVPHLGHLLLLKHASSYGRVYVALNSDEWIMKNKGYRLFDYESRKMNLEEIPYVHSVVDFNDKDGTVCDALRKVKPTFFGNGGTANNTNIPKEELDVCLELDIEPIFGLGECADTVEQKYLILVQGTILRETIKEVDKLQRFRELYKN